MKQGIRKDLSIVLAVCLLLCWSVILSLSKDLFAFALPDTGQTRCYNTVGAEISCAGTGQDGAYNINPMSYTDNGGGTVTDNNTGLMWQKCSAGQNNDSSCSGTASALSWTAAGTYCDTSTLGSFSDWRLPSKKELITIVDYSIPYPGPAIMSSYFPNTVSDTYLTATTAAWNTGFVLDGNFADGYFGWYTKSDGAYVRCVRGDQAFTSFTDNGNGTVTDSRTGLMWQQDEVVYWSDVWQDGSDYCKGLTIGPYSDWRVPNIKELESITDDARYNPAINTDYFPGASPEYHLSSTTLANNPHYFFGGIFLDGSVWTGTKDSSSYVRCVRAGYGALFNVTVSKEGTGSGTVTSNPAGIDCGSDCTETYSAGVEVTLTATPSTGSGFAGWSGACTGMGSCVLEETGVQAVTATFQIPTFTDVPADHWAFGWIEMMYANDITTGYPDGTYRPTGNVTRGQMAVFIIRALFGDTFDYELEAHFTDVPNTHSLFKYIQKMYDEGITMGYSDGTYRPSQNVQRSQMASFIIKAMYPGGFSYTLTPYFSDVPSGHWAFQYVQRMYDDAITTGYTDGTYRPSDYVNRAQMAAFIGRAFLGRE